MLLQLHNFKLLFFYNGFRFTMQFIVFFYLSLCILLSVFSKKIPNFTSIEDLENYYFKTDYTKWLNESKYFQPKSVILNKLKKQ